MMSLLYRKIYAEEKGMYWIQPYTAKENYAVFESLPATVFGGALLFFSSTKKRLLRSTRVSLAEVGSKAILEASGVGILPSTPSQGKASLRWTALQRKVLGQRLRTWHT